MIWKRRLYVNEDMFWCVKQMQLQSNHFEVFICPLPGMPCPRKKKISHMHIEMYVHARMHTQTKNNIVNTNTLKYEGIMIAGAEG